VYAARATLGNMHPMTGMEGANDDALVREVERLRTQVAELQRAAARHEGDVFLNERYELVREAERVMHVGTWTWDLQTDKITWSDELYRIFGLDPATTIAGHEAFNNTIHPADRARMAALSAHGVREGIFPLMEYRVLRPDGTVRLVSLTSVFMFDAQGKPRRLIGAVLDRTDSLGVEAELRRTLALLEEAQRFAQVGSWRYDPETEETEWSNEFRRIAGLPPDMVPSIPALLQCIIGEDRSTFIERCNAIMSQPGGGQLDGRLQRPNGEIRHIRLSGALVDSDNGRKELRGTMLDITEQVRMREELAHSQKMQAVGRLAAGIAHDFNNLLTIVTGNLALLVDTYGNCAELEDSLRAVESAANLTQRLLAFGRRANLTLTVLEPNDLVRSTLALLHRLVGDQVRLHAHFAANLPPIRVDAVEIERALVNLVVNARDVVPPGGTVTISTREQVNTDGHWVEITVSDDGPGIRDADLPHIFEPFYSTRVGAGGTGLGLATVLGTAEQHGGTVRAQTQLGKGSSFTISLPAVRSETVSKPVPAPVTSRPAQRQLTILVVDDEPMVAEATRRMLTSQGHRVTVATSPSDVLALWPSKANEFDVVVCDVVMPEMRGPELVQQLSLLGHAPRVLFMSGYNEEAALTRSPIPVLAKPFSLSALENAIAQVLADAEQRTHENRRL
jgi:two-component system cell cycle sensor histidine kinase/response regulator CckA